jgi:hypothetical protein
MVQIFNAVVVVMPVGENVTNLKWSNRFDVNRCQSHKDRPEHSDRLHETSLAGHTYITLAVHNNTESVEVPQIIGKVLNVDAKACIVTLKETDTALVWVCGNRDDVKADFLVGIMDFVVKTHKACIHGRRDNNKRSVPLAHAVYCALLVGPVHFFVSILKTQHIPEMNHASVVGGVWFPRFTLLEYSVCLSTKKVGPTPPGGQKRGKKQKAREH